ncbi:unnamed protein product [Nesidiocoris tenuis]|uniref:ZU5 domain-containing protein n=1 Tax=Nesidiocoris tenuis TaxID=355587 RepID=A0A6H5HPD8_9HEMI|nr:unnamed protein product [Nesidiocoris tenuis]
MRGCRHSGVNVVVPPRAAAAPIRLTCRYLRNRSIAPPLSEAQALATRVLELSPAGNKFLGPIIIEVPHFVSLRGKERELVVMRSDNGVAWKEHSLEDSQNAVQHVLNSSFEGGDDLDEAHANRVTRVVTTELPQYLAVVSRLRQEVHVIGPEGGVVSSSAVPLVQAIFPPNALTKKIRVGLQDLLHLCLQLKLLFEEIWCWRICVRSSVTIGSLSPKLWASAGKILRSSSKKFTRLLKGRVSLLNCGRRTKELKQLQLCRHTHCSSSIKFSYNTYLFSILEILGGPLSSDSENGLLGGDDSNSTRRKTRRAVGSSSGSDVALHEGNDLSDSDPGEPSKVNQ